MNKLALLALALALPLSACEREPAGTPVLAEPGAGIVPAADSTTNVVADPTTDAIDAVADSTTETL